MTISEIVKLEDVNEEFIILHEEGIFLRAYEHSSFAFSTQIAEMQILKRAYKNLGGREVTYLGFPMAVADTYLSGLELVESAAKTVTYRAPRKWDETDYRIWHDGIAVREAQTADARPEQQNAVACELENLVRSFDVSTSTPIDAFNFVLKLKQIVRER